MLTGLHRRLSTSVLQTTGIAACLVKPVRQSRLFDTLVDVLSPDSANGSAETASAARAGSRRTAVAAGTSVLMARTLAVLKGATPAQAIARYPGSTTGSASPPRGRRPAQGSTTARPVGGASGGTTYYSPSAEGADTSGMLLNYLLGN